MINRDALVQQKIREAEKRIAELHERFPRLQEIAEEISKLSLARIRVGFLQKNSLQAEAIDKKVMNLIREKELILKANSLSLDIYEPDWNCPRCKDKGYLEPGILCECFKQERINKIFQQSGIQGNMQKQTFASFDTSFYDDPQGMERKVGRCKEFVINLINNTPQNNLFFTGQVGRGKTHLSLAIANAVLDYGLTVIYKRIDELLDIIRDYKYQWEAGHLKQSQELQLLKEADLLIIDDLGTESLTPFAENQIRMLIEDRNNLNRPWVINSNLRIKELQAKYGQRVTDRIIEKADIFSFESKMSIRELLKRKEMEKNTY